MIDAIKRRPVRFVFFIEALLGVAIVFGVGLTVDQVGALMLAVNAFFAFWLDQFTTPLDRNGNPLNAEYHRIQR